MNIIQLTWLIISIAFSIPAMQYFYYTWKLYQKSGNVSAGIKREVNTRLIASIMFLVTELAFFAIGFLGVIRPDLGEYTIVILVAGVFALSSAVMLLSRLSMPKRYTIQGKLAGVIGGLIIIIMIGGTVFAFSNAATPPLKPAPFIYSSSVMPMVDPELCPGDPLQVEISGVSDGIGRTSFVTGSIIIRGEPSQRVFIYPTIEATSLSNPEMAGKEVTFIFNGKIAGRVVPELAAGEYTYIHGVYESGSLTNAFESHFTVLDDCQ